MRAVVEGEFSVLKKGKDTFQSYSSVFNPLWIAVFSPMIPFMAAILLALPAVSRAHLVPDIVLVIGFYAGISAWPSVVVLRPRLHGRRRAQTA